MKLGVLAASALIGMASLTASSFAQGDGSHVMQEVSRVPQAGTSGVTANRMATSGAVPVLQGVRPAAGMLPQQPSGPVRGVVGTASSAPIDGGDIQHALRSE